METWLAFATRRDGPAAKQGYPSAPNRSVNAIEGIVMHSMEGSMAAAMGELDKLARRASWTFSNPKAGPLVQHYELEAITYASGSIEANKRFVPVENEGVAGEPLTDSQVANLRQLMDALKGLCQIVKGKGWVRQDTAWEHCEMTYFGSSATACPSGRIPWITLLQEEEHMGLTEDQNNKLNTTWQKVEELWNLLRAGETTGGPGWVSGGLRQLVQEEVDRAIAALQEGDGSHSHGG